MRFGLALAIVAASAATAAAARTVTFPLVVDYPIVEAAFRRDLGMTEGSSLELWGTPGGCHWAVADEMALDTQGGKLRVQITGSTVVGFRLLWFCVSPIGWQGTPARELFHYFHTLLAEPANRYLDSVFEGPAARRRKPARELAEAVTA